MDQQQNDDNDEDGQHPSAVPSALVTQTPVSEKELKRLKKKENKKEKKRRARELGVPYESEKKKKKKDKNKKESPLKEEEEDEKIGSNSCSSKKEYKHDTSTTLNGIKQKSATQIEKISLQKAAAAASPKHHQTPTTNGSIFSLIATSTKSSSSSSSSTHNNSKHNNNKQSPYQIKTILGTVALLPTSLPNVAHHITNLLQTLLLMYDSNMGGVLLSLENDVTLLPVDYKTGSSRGNNSGLIGGRIVDDLPYIHYKFSVDVLLFCPILGMKLSGKVVECTPTYITLTTHHILSTKISSETLHSEGYYYNGMTMEWVRERVVTSTGSGAMGVLKRDDEEEDEDDDRLGPSTSIYLDDNVEFIIERIHECGGYISLDGTRPSVSTLG